MGAPGFWDDQERAAPGQRRARARHAQARGRSARLQADVEDLEGLAELAEEDPELRGRARASRSPPSSARLAGARGGAAVLRPLRLGRRARDRQRRRRRHRRPGLGRDGAAHGDALGREARLRGRAARGQPGGGGRDQVGHVPGVAARTPTACTRPRRACTGSCACRPSTPPTAARRASPASRSSPVVEDAGDVEIDDDDLQVDTYRASRRRRPARQQDRLGRAHHPPPERHRRAVPERALAVVQQGDRDGDAALQARRARGAQAPRGDRAREGRGAGRQLRLADPLLRPAPVHDGQGPPHRASRWATSSACSTATSTTSCAPTSSQEAGRDDAGERPRAPADGPSRAAADRAVPRRARRLRLPRLRRASTSPATRAGAGADPGLRHAIGEDGADARRPAGHRRHRPRPAADAVRARRAARRRGATAPRARGSSPTAPRRATTRSASRSRRSARRVVVQRNSHALARRRPRALAAACRAASRPSTTTSSAWRTASRRSARGGAGRARPAPARRSSSRPPTTAWPPTSRAAPRSRTPPAPRSSSTSRGARTSASTPTCRRARCTQGADAVLTSTHKIVGSLTQSAMLHVADDRPHRPRRGRAHGAARALDVSPSRC